MDKRSFCGVAEAFQGQDAGGQNFKSNEAQRGSAASAGFKARDWLGPPTLGLDVSTALTCARGVSRETAKGAWMPSAPGSFYFADCPVLSPLVYQLERLLS